MDRFTWAIVAGVLALVVAGVAAAALLRTQPTTPPDLATPEGVTLAYGLALQRGDGAAAWDLLSASAQATGRRDTFIVRAGGPRADSTSLRVEDVQVDPRGNGATTVLVRTTMPRRGPFPFFDGSEPFSSRATVRLVREGGQWRISAPPDPFLWTLRD